MHVCVCGQTDKKRKCVCVCVAKLRDRVCVCGQPDSVCVYDVVSWPSSEDGDHVFTGGDPSSVSLYLLSLRQ